MYGFAVCIKTSAIDWFLQLCKAAAITLCKNNTSMLQAEFTLRKVNKKDFLLGLNNGKAIVLQKKLWSII